MAADDPHFRLRIPPVLKARIEYEARANGRSINGEIVARLEASIPASDRRPDPRLVERIAIEIAQIIERGRA